MRFAGLYPNRVKGLISLDTAPTGTAEDKKRLTRQSIEAIKALDVEGKSKKAALDVIQQKFQDRGVANMISNNLAYTEEDNHQKVRWCINFNSILNSLDSLVGFEPASTKYQGPSFFLNGSLSVQYNDEIYRKEFPKSENFLIDGAGHYIYYDKTQTTARILSECLLKIE